MRLGWVVLVAGMALAMTGCTKAAKEQDLADCQVKGTTIYPHWRTEEEISKEMGEYISECMLAKGYVGDDPNGECSTGTQWVNEIVSFCYRKPWPWE